jgi:toxin ParE1/3/4
MKKVVLSAPARADLREIAAYTRERWGERQARAYLAEFKARFTALAALPELGRPRNDLAVGLRSILVGRHLVFYRRSAARITVSRVLHSSTDIQSKFDA